MPVRATSRRLFVSTLALAAALAGQASAQEASLQKVNFVDEVTVSATRSEKKIEDVPATVSVITAEKIEENLVVDIKDLVRFEPGVAVRNSPARFGAAQGTTGRDGNAGFNIRGLEGNRVLIQVDGIRTPDAYSFGAQSVGRGDYVDLDILKSVEIVRGPASALYGSDGLAGSVSFTTKDPSDFLKDGKTYAGRMRAGYNSADDSWSKSVVFAAGGTRWQGLLAYTRRDGHEQETKGVNDAPNLTRTTANPEDNASNAILGKLVYRFNDQNRLRLTWDHADNRIDWNVLSGVAVPPLATTSVIGLTAYDDMRRDRVSLDHRYESADGFVRMVHLTGYYQDSHTRQFTAEDRFTAADRTRDSTFDNQIWGGLLEARSEFGGPGFLNRLVYGADYSRTRQVSVRGGTVPPVGEAFPSRAFPTTVYTLGGVFLQDEIETLNGALSLFPAIRWDYYKLDPRTDALYTAGVPSGQSADRFTPKLGVVFRANDMVTLFANAASGFKAPAPSQVNNGFANPVTNYRSQSNPNLRPETSRTLEGGLRLHGDGWSLSGAVYTGEYKDFIDQVQVGGNYTPANPAVFQFVNLANVKISGWELRGRAKVGAGFTLDAAAARTKGTSTLNGVKSSLATVEPIKVVLGVGWQEGEGRFGGQLSAVYNGRKSPTNVGVTCTPSCFRPAPFVVLDLTTFWHINDAVTARAGVFNLLDQTYYWWSDVRGLAANSSVRQAYSQPGRNIGVSLAIRR